MRAATRQAQHHIARCNIIAAQDFRFFNRTHTKPGQVIFACRVHAGHFGGLAANQCAVAQLAALGNAANHSSSYFNIKLAAGKIVQEKQRLCTLHQHIVHTHSHQVNADGVMHLPFKRQLELGAHAVGAADQYRFFKLFRHFKHRAKAANACEHAFTHGSFSQRLDAFNQRISRINVDTGVFVADGGGDIRGRHDG